MTYPAAVTFPFGNGRVYFTSFPAPSGSLTSFRAPEKKGRLSSPEQALADWFLSKPIANIERKAAMNRAESSSGRIVERADGTVFRAKTAGLMVKLPASEDVTVAVQMSRLWLRSAGDISGETEGRRWTASLRGADGRVFETRATRGPLLSFCVAGGKNSGGLWQVHLDAAPGHPEGNLLVVTVIRGLVTLGGESVSNDVHPDVPVTDLRVEPDSADLRVGERVSLKAVLSPSDATDRRVSWSVSAPSVVSADASGRVTARSTRGATS